MSHGRGKEEAASSRPRSSSAKGSVPRIRVPAVPKGPPWEVVFHPDGHKELHLLKGQSNSNYDAVLAVIEKLKVHGPALKSPHQSGVKGDLGKGSGSCARREVRRSYARCTAASTTST